MIHCRRLSGFAAARGVHAGQSAGIRASSQCGIFCGSYAIGYDLEGDAEERIDFWLEKVWLTEKGRSEDQKPLARHAPAHRHRAERSCPTRI